MAENVKLTAILEADDRTRSGFDSAAGGMDKLKKAATVLGAAFVAAFAVGKIVEFGKKSVEAFVESERAARQLEYAVVSISKGTKEQVKTINDLAEAMQRKAGIDGDALKIGAAQLSTFGLQSESVVKLTKSLADLTVNQNGVNATADQYQQSANTMAKALNGQFGILEKSGIRFTEAQQAMIMYGTETEKVAALQEGLNQNLKETTDTIGATAEGAMARFERAFGEIQESLGGILVPLLAQVAEGFVPILQKIQAFSDSIGGIEGIREAFRNFLTDLDAQTGLVTLFKDAWANLVFVYQEQLKPALDELWVALQPYKPYLEALAQVFGTMLVIAIGGLILILGSLAIALTGLLTAITKVTTYFTNNVVGMFKKVGDAIAWPIQQVEKLVRAIERLNVVQGLKNLGSKLSGRATGGPVSAGVPYMTGENGPELFTPATAGYITKNSALGGGITINVTGGTFMGIDDFAQQAGKSLMKELGLSTKFAL